MNSQNRISSDEANATKVFVRIRPFNVKERKLTEDTKQLPYVLRVDENNPSLITTLDPSKEMLPKDTYVFERCFDDLVASYALEEGAKGKIDAAEKRKVGKDQSLVYSHVGKPVLTNALQGYNGCVFAYGQTGSGKTFTMMGPTNIAVAKCDPSTPRVRDKKGLSESVTPRLSGESNETNGATQTSGVSTPMDALEDSALGGEEAESAGLEGIIPRLTREMIDELHRKREKDSSLSFRIEMEYFEIYNEKVMDLLTAGGNKNVELRVRNSASGPYIEGLSRKHVEDERQIFKLIRKGNLERHTAATKMNDRSSRSHAILSFHITQFRLDMNDNASKIVSKLNLVDLAGSERTGASGVEGKQFKEATKINLSLTTLGRVIDALASISQNKKGVFCPYRDSNLTWVLADSLGGNCKTTMVATVSPHAVNFEETCQTLRYASRAKQIVTKVVVNEDPTGPSNQTADRRGATSAADH
ncbi:Kinesin motor domain/Microtubule binding, putative [Angomonas deanei]|uniref:Kinesin-like protein n=1 Tax=Angomonas deanei TaxID=59799 RepID=A0A7G2CDS2_9TRYP|nr:Kinesin motor domain/Microtubule binding, putative [Angomonas deanei]